MPDDELPAGAAAPTGTAAPGPSPEAGASEALGAPRPVYLLAGWGQRLGAYLVDLGILMIPLLGAYALLIPGLIERAGDDPRLDAEFDAILEAEGTDFSMDRILHWALVITLTLTVAYWVLIGLYSAMFMSRTAGQTPGRKMVGIRVMRVDGRPIGFWWALYRTLVIREGLFGIGSLLSGGLLFLAQYLWPLWDPQRRALHDVVARSRVVQDAEDHR